MSENSGSKKKRKTLRPNKIILRRTLVLLILCGIVALAIPAGQLYKVMIVDHDRYEEMAIENQTREVTIPASRGTIYDAGGKILAMSASVETVFISPYEIANPYTKEEIEKKGEKQAQEDEEANKELIVSELSRILGVDAQALRDKMTRTYSWYETVSTKIEKELADEVRVFIRDSKVRGVYLESDTKRYYPESSLASHLIGFVGVDRALAGLELTYNQYLSGTDGRVVRLKDARGTDLLFNDFENFYDAQDGNDITLTIDSTVQYFVEKYLAQAVEDYDILNGAACIAMGAKTGEVLAMSSMGEFDLNNFLQLAPDVQEELDLIEDPEEKQAQTEAARYAQWRNKALADTYEPGSVFKIFTLAMALEEGIVTEESTFHCDGAMEGIPGRTSPLHCWKRTGHGSQTLSQAMQNSCNVALVSIGLEVGAKTFYDYMDAFGFFDKTGVDLPGEAKSLWWSYEHFSNPKDRSSLASASFGQTMTVTPMQLVTAVSAATNGGYLMEPYVVSQVTDADGNVVLANEPTVVRQVISEETSAQVRTILEEVVTIGTGKNARVKGYRIGGKTGTSEKVTENLMDGTTDMAGGGKSYIVSFCGVAPIDDPEVVLLLLLDTPSASTGMYQSGGVMAAPVAGAMLSEILPYLGVEPEYTDEEKEQLDVMVPRVTELSPVEAKTKLMNLGLSVTVTGDGDTVTAQLPAPNADVAPGTKVVLYAGAEPPQENVTVPDLTDRTYSSAKSYLEGMGLFIRSTGALPAGNSGDIVVWHQSVAGGEEIPYGTVIEVTLVDNSIQGQY